MKSGDLVRYMSRIVLIIYPGLGGPNDWVYGIELGETNIAKYKQHALGAVISETR